MNAIVQFVLKHGCSVLFAAMFAHQIGFPVPGPLFLLAAGALARNGNLGFAPAFFLAVNACVLADWVWYEAGLRRGDKVLHFIHSLAARDHDAHDRRAKETFARYGPPLLLLCKFVPGLDAVVPPMAGASRTSRLRFLALETAGAGLYSGAYAGLGFVFSHDLNRAVAYVSRAGRVLAALAFTGLCHRSRRDSRCVHITPANRVQVSAPGLSSGIRIDEISLRRRFSTASSCIQTSSAKLREPWRMLCRTHFRIPAT
jgi:membrane protein DedA with SNARE-associated domain